MANSEAVSATVWPFFSIKRYYNSNNAGNYLKLALKVRTSGIRSVISSEGGAAAFKRAMASRCC
jgi:hypothetical protein